MEAPKYFVLNPIHVEYDHIPKYKKMTEFDEENNWYYTMVVYPFHYQKHKKWLTLKNRLLRS
jgi:hypothetical protein